MMAPNATVNLPPKVWISLANQTLSVSTESNQKPIRKIVLDHAVVRHSLDAHNAKLLPRSSHTMFSFTPKGENSVIVDVNGDSDCEADRFVLTINFSDKIKKVGL